MAIAKFSGGIDGAGIQVHKLQMVDLFGPFLGFGLGLLYNDGFLPPLRYGASNV